MLTVEYMRELENSLTPQQKQKAFDLAEKNGWKHGDMMPMWVWKGFFEQVKADREVL